MCIKCITKLIVLPLLLFATACSPLLNSILPTATSQSQTQMATSTAESIPASGQASQQQPTAESNGASPGGASPELKISDQALDAGMVTVDEVVSNGPGWVAIYTTNDNGQPDQVIGHAAVKDGINDKVMVQVDPAKATGTLYAQLHADRGTVGSFEFPGPDAPVLVGLQLVGSNFKVSEAQANSTETQSESMRYSGMGNSSSSNDAVPSIYVTNQPIIDSKIVIREVISVGNAWVVIHRLNGDGTTGSMVGFAKVKDGVNKNVAVTVDTNNTSKTMSAMLHQDNANQASPQFPGADGPVMVNGQMVNPTFEVTASSANADVFIGLGNQVETKNYLVDANDMTLYVSLLDTPGKSNCDAVCQQTWKPLLATGRIIAGSGVNSKNLGVILLPDGRRLVTYLGAPLYLYSKDEKPGDVNGQGFDGTWYLIAP